MPHKLPLTLQVNRIDRTPNSIEIDASIVDADSTSVRHASLSVGPKRTAAEVCAILQNHVDTLSRDLFKRGEATTAPAQTEAESEEAFEALKSRVFTGSVST